MPFTVLPGAGLIDFTNNVLKTPVGDFTITQSGETKIHFTDISTKSIAKGQLDRLTGALSIHWATPEEWASFEAGSGALHTMSASLTCRPASKLF